MRTKMIVLFGLLMLGLTVNMAAEQAAISVPVDNFDFGYVPRDANICHRFWLYSKGPDTLKISNVRPGCGCTKAPLDKAIVAPGDSTAVELIFNTKNYSGKVSKSATIMTNAIPATNRVSFSAFIIKDKDTTLPLAFTPEIVKIRCNNTKNHVKALVSIKNVSANDLMLALDSYPDGLFEVKLPKKIKAGKQANAEIRISNKAAAFEKSFTIQVDDAEKTRFTIPVVYGDSLDNSVHTNR
ncbi:MAG: DUF1573 domain-containing protein [candidate division Zixibacteria bacterium]|nr:DUF1573 domain-containing protein [candidate division Zixibacteria bacterium]